MQCPKCSCMMVMRKNNKTGSQFWGCVDFPNCNGVLPYHQLKPNNKKGIYSFDYWKPVLLEFGNVTNDELCGGRYQFFIEEMKCTYFKKNNKVLVTNEGKSKWEKNGMNWILQQIK